MKNRSQLIRSIAAILLAITMMLSLASCSIDFDFYDDLFNGKIPDFNDGNDNDKDFPGFGIFDDTIESDNYGDFYPGSGSESIDSLSPKTKTLLSTVSIVADFGTATGGGSGVFYSVDKKTGDAYVITNYHVVYESAYEGAESINIYLYGMELSSYAIPATLLGGSVTYDIAVLKVTASEVIKNSYAIPASFADSELVRVFDRVYVVGNAEAKGMSATEGIVSVESESLQLEGADGKLITLRVIRIDAAVNLGNSGGGLYDEDGKLAGIVSAKDVGSNVDNMGYAIPSNLVKQLVDNIIDHCDGKNNTKVSKALLGITITSYVSGLEIDEENGEVSHVELVEVIEITKGSLAEGKVMVGDVINSITIEGKTRNVTRIHHVTDFMLEARVGDTVQLNVTRDGKTLTLSFVIGEENMSETK